MTVEQTAFSENSSRFAGVHATYDPWADALYLYLRADSTKVALTHEVADGITADLDAAGRLIGYEILGVSRLPRPDEPQGG